MRHQYHSQANFSASGQGSVNFDGIIVNRFKKGNLWAKFSMIYIRLQYYSCLSLVTERTRLYKNIHNAYPVNKMSEQRYDYYRYIIIIENFIMKNLHVVKTGTETSPTAMKSR